MLRCGNMKASGNTNDRKGLFVGIPWMLLELACIMRYLSCGKKAYNEMLNNFKQVEPSATKDRKIGCMLSAFRRQLKKVRLKRIGSLSIWGLRTIVAVFQRTFPPSIPWFKQRKPNVKFAFPIFNKQQLPAQRSNYSEAMTEECTGYLLHVGNRDALLSSVNFNWSCMGHIKVLNRITTGTWDSVLFEPNLNRSFISNGAMPGSH